MTQIIKKLKLGNFILNIKDPKQAKIEIVKSLKEGVINGNHAYDYVPIELSEQNLKSFFHIQAVKSTQSYLFFELEKSNFDIVRIHKYYDENFYRVSVITSVSLISTCCRYVHELQNILDYCNFKYNEEQE